MSYNNISYSIEKNDDINPLEIINPICKKHKCINLFNNSLFSLRNNFILGILFCLNILHFSNKDSVSILNLYFYILN